MIELDNIMRTPRDLAEQEEKRYIAKKKSDRMIELDNIMRKSRDYDRKIKLEREEKEAKEAERQALETERQVHRIEAIYALEAKLAQKRET